jgi:ribosome-binding protein aMBF1 (putative translation factor)
MDKQQEFELRCCQRCGYLTDGPTSCYVEGWGLYVCDTCARERRRRREDTQAGRPAPGEGWAMAKRQWVVVDETGCVVLWCGTDRAAAERVADEIECEHGREVRVRGRSEFDRVDDTVIVD